MMTTARNHREAGSSRVLAPTDKDSGRVAKGTLLCLLSLHAEVGAGAAATTALSRPSPSGGSFCGDQC